MSALMKMLGVDGVDFATLGKRMVEGIEQHDANQKLMVEKLDSILINQVRIMHALNIPTLEAVYLSHQDTKNDPPCFDTMEN